jgi:O-antigen/teichoic acid export membrane protein
MSAGVLSTLFVYADLVLLYWIGGAQGLVVAQQSTAALRWLLAGFFIQSLALIPAIFCEGMGRPALNNSFAVASAVIHVPLVLVLVPRLGITGAALALFINGSVQTVVFIGLASWRIAKVTPADLFARSVARPLAAVGLAGGFGYLIRPMVHGPGSLALALLLTAAAYLLASVLVGAVKTEDLAHLDRFFQRLPAWFPGRTTLLRTAPTMER